MNRCAASQRAFSLVELSIVLVILGLLVGGVLSGRSLIEAAQLRSQLNQISNYRVAAHTFKDKYFFLPGDLTEPTASSAGFVARGVGVGRGDGNGLLEGINTAGVGGPGRERAGETAIFWRDLSKAGLIEGSFSTADAVPPMSSVVDETSSPSISDYFPRGKIDGTYLYITGAPAFSTTPLANSLQVGKNYLFLSRVSESNSGGIDTTGGGGGARGLKVMQAYGIDQKTDDGQPMTGKVMALYTQYAVASWPSGAGFGIPTTASDTSCMDNGNNGSNPVVYSTQFSDSGTRPCPLTFEAI